MIREYADWPFTEPYRVSAAAPTLPSFFVPRHRTRLKVPEPSPVVALRLIRDTRAYKALVAVNISDVAHREVRKG